MKKGLLLLTVMLCGCAATPSDVGLITQGPRRGEFINRPGTSGIDSASPECLAYFGYKAKAESVQ